jgi:hypothetical protein
MENLPKSLQPPYCSTSVHLRARAPSRESGNRVNHNFDSVSTLQPGCPYNSPVLYVDAQRIPWENVIERRARFRWQDAPGDEISWIRDCCVSYNALYAKHIRSSHSP